MSSTTPRPRPPSLGEAAPYFEAPSTYGRVRLTDYAGRWLVFFAHPADFTPVCTSEVVSFARRHHDFQALHCALVGISRDSVKTHLAWIRSIEESFGVSVAFPILEDPSLAISRLYAMAPTEAGDAASLRALFVIDPAGKLRASLYYPCTTGRSVEEVLRLVHALQLSDLQGTVAPEGWRPGDAMLAAPKLTVIAKEDPRELGYGCVDWFDYAPPATSMPGAPPTLTRREAAPPPPPPRAAAGVQPERH